MFAPNIPTVRLHDARHLLGADIDAEVGQSAWKTITCLQGDFSSRRDGTSESFDLPFSGQVRVCAVSASHGHHSLHLHPLENQRGRELFVNSTAKIEPEFYHLSRAGARGAWCIEYTAQSYRALVQVRDERPVYHADEISVVGKLPRARRWRRQPAARDEMLALWQTRYHGRLGEQLSAEQPSYAVWATERCERVVVVLLAFERFDDRHYLAYEVERYLPRQQDDLHAVSLLAAAVAERASLLEERARRSSDPTDDVALAGIERQMLLDSVQRAISR